jgi:phospholipid transport system transporter-binding protein
VNDSTQVLTSNDKRWVVAGPLTIENIVAVLAESARRILPESGEVDLRDVEPVDSSGVALLLEWKRRALAENKPISFQNIPPSMTSLALLYGVDELLMDTPA